MLSSYLELFSLSISKLPFTTSFTQFKNSFPLSCLPETPRLIIVNSAIEVLPLCGLQCKIIQTLRSVRRRIHTDYK